MVSCFIMRSDVQNCIFSQNQHGDYLFIDGIVFNSLLRFPYFVENFL